LKREKRKITDERARARFNPKQRGEWKEGPERQTKRDWSSEGDENGGVLLEKGAQSIFMGEESSVTAAKGDRSET